MYSFLEQHLDGAWWYHPFCTYETKEEAEQGFLKTFWWDTDRPHKIIQHEKPFPQNHSRCTSDFIHFGFGGVIDFELE